jgi:hypothetical protein
MPPIDINNVGTTRPPDLEVNVAPDGVNVAGATEVVPQAVQGITTAPMLPVTYAGLQLAKIVLTILAISLAFLMLYLWTSEWRYGSNQAIIYEKVLSQATSAPNSLNQALTDKYITTLRDAALDSNVTLDAEEQAAAQPLFTSLKRVGAISDQQLASLNGCIPFPSISDGRAAAFISCAGILDEAKKKIMAASPALERIRLLTDFSKQVNEHRQNFHTAWFQEAQLILLNLLLPLLTGLFGYIFGTQQAPGARRDQT